MSSPNQKNQDIPQLESGAPPLSHSIDEEKVHQEAAYRVEGQPMMHVKEQESNSNALSSDALSYNNEKPTSTSASPTSITPPPSSSGLRSRNRAISSSSDATPFTQGLMTTASAINSNHNSNNNEYTAVSGFGLGNENGRGRVVDGDGKVNAMGTSTAISTAPPDSDNNTAFERSRPPSDNTKITSKYNKFTTPGSGSSGGDGNNTNNSNNNTSTSNENGFDEFEGMGGIPWSKRSFWYQFTPFRGMYHDIKLRLPYYASDWTVAFKPNNLYRVVAASIRMYFVNLLPAIAYLLDMNHRTNGNYGINEVILASALAAIVFPIFSCQPLTIVGVTGLINLFNYTDYNIVTRYGVDYLQFQCWMLIWAAVFHFLVAIFNISDYSRFITDMTSEAFGFYVGIVYIQKGIELIIYEFEDAEPSGWLVVVIAIMFSLSVYFIQRTGGLGFGPFWFRKFLADFAMPISAIWWSGFAHIPGEIKSTPLRFLPITRSWFPSTYRNWVISFWELEGKWIAAAIPFGFLLMLLFYFDHNVSSLMAQARQYPVKRPAGFHWDFFVLGWVTFVSGLLGLPAPNGLVPQAPVNSESLSVLAKVDVDYDAKEGIIVPEEDYETWKKRTENERKFMEHKIVRTRLVEQRVSHLAIGLLTLGTMSRPLLVCLGLMPRALFAGVFLVVGWGSIEGNGITHKTLFLLRDRRMIPRDHILLHTRRRKIFLYVFIQWLFFAMTFAISQTIAAIGFPVIITLLIPLRFYFGPKWFTPEELAILDAPTANSPAVMVSIGSDLSRVTGEGKEVAEDTGIAGTLARSSVKGDEEKAQIDRLNLFRIRSRQEDDMAHVQNITSIRR